MSLDDVFWHKIFITGFKVKESSKLGPRPEKRIEIYEFERYERWGSILMLAITFNCVHLFMTNLCFLSFWFSFLSPFQVLDFIIDLLHCFLSYFAWHGTCGNFFSCPFCRKVTADEFTLSFSFWLRFIAIIYSYTIIMKFKAGTQRSGLLFV